MPMFTCHYHQQHTYGYNDIICMDYGHPTNGNLFEFAIIKFPIDMSEY